MSVTVDHERLEVETLGLRTIGQVLSHLQRDNRLVVNLLIDGQQPDFDCLPQVRQSPINGHTLFIETAEPKEMALEVISEVETQLREADRLKADAVELLQKSGGAVKALATFYKIPPARMIAIHDELDIAFGTLRIKFGGGDNGHNGLKSMRSSLATGDFYRVRAGIGRPPGRQDVADFVLSNYTTAERKELPFQVADAADAVESLITEGLEKTQQRFNS